ncbi:amidophosphoribosyltransferase [Penicillium longicatenatum]|nr:amidophosphoribosyltransferase [Penicillium longicatenatum]
MADAPLTRAAARAAAAPATRQSITTPTADPVTTHTPTTTKAAKGKKKVARKATSRTKPNVTARKAMAKTKQTAALKTAKAAAGKKARADKKAQKAVLKQVADEDFPHNIGPDLAPLSATKLFGLNKENQLSSDAVDKVTSELQASMGDMVNGNLQGNSASQSPKKAEAKKARYRPTPGVTPFPSWTHPTAEECEVANKLLSSVHGEVIAPKVIPPPSLTVTGCGEVPSVLDALIRTLLSGATTSSNSARAFNGLVQRFGILNEGIGKGSVDWDAVRRASMQDVFNAIKSGGLATMKSMHLKKILDLVYEESQQRLGPLKTANSLTTPTKEDPDAPNHSLEVDEESKLAGPIASTEVFKMPTEYEIACADQNFLSLNHLHSLSSEEAMIELTKYPGIGPKTAACVLLFCLQRPCFAVDTHIFRLSKWLGWIPPTGVNEVSAFNHLEVRVPDHLKYSLHQLLIRHGKDCPRCRAITGEGAAGWNDGCVIDHLVKRTGKRKGASSAPTKVEKKGKAKTAVKKRKKKTATHTRPAKRAKTAALPAATADTDETEDPELSEVSDTVLDDISD